MNSDYSCSIRPNAMTIENGFACSPERRRLGPTSLLRPNGARWQSPDQRPGRQSRVYLFLALKGRPGLRAVPGQGALSGLGRVGDPPRSQAAGLGFASAPRWARRACSRFLHTDLERATQLGRTVFTQDDDFLALADEWLRNGRE